MNASSLKLALNFIDPNCLLKLSIAGLVVVLFSPGFANAMQATPSSQQQKKKVEPYTTLNDQLQAMAEQSSKRFPKQLLDTMENAIQEVRDTDLVEEAKKKGDQAIDATLTNDQGRAITLSEQWKSGPVVLMWYRGGWCPYCNIQLQEMNKRIKNLESVGAKLVVVTPELPEMAKQTKEKNSLQVEVLHDPHNALARKYGLVFTLPAALQPLYRDQLGLAKYNGDDSMELPLAATYVVDTEGTIQYSFLDEDYKKRAEPDEIMGTIRKITGPPEVGQFADDFSLPTFAPIGKSSGRISLGEKLQEGPVVLVMLRGFPGYQCPICSRQVARFVAKAKSFTEAGASVVMVYPGAMENPTALSKKATEFMGDTKLPENFDLLIDSDYAMTNLYGLRWDAPRETAYPSTFVIDTNGKIQFAEISQTHGGRSEVEDVLNALKNLSTDK